MKWNLICFFRCPTNWAGNQAAPTAARQANNSTNQTHALLCGVWWLCWRRAESTTQSIQSIKSLTFEWWLMSLLAAAGLPPPQLIKTFLNQLLVPRGEREEMKSNQSLHSFMRMKIDWFHFSFHKLSLFFNNNQSIEEIDWCCWLIYLIKGRKVNQWSGILLNECSQLHLIDFFSSPAAHSMEPIN